MSMVDEVAKAIRLTHRNCACPPQAVAKCQCHIAAAKAAMLTMRKPTPEMVAAGEHGHEWNGFELGWEEAIDTAMERPAGPQSTGRAS